jgi:hypothetical protein
LVGGRDRGSSSRVLGGNELPIPAQDRVRRQQAGDVAQQASAEHLAPNRQASSLVVGELQPPAVQM